MITRLEWIILSIMIMNLIKCEFKNNSLSVENKEQEYKKEITSNGYSFEEHTIETKDGYLLSVWRLPKKLTSKTINKKVIILQHGLLDDAWSWFTLKKDYSLSYLLVENGYDVWVPNIRGNLFSYKHKNIFLNGLDPFSKYWDFSWEEMVDYDLPAIINYIKAKTLVKKVDYIGHSQGTTIFFLGYMVNPSYMSENINKFVALGPVPSISNATSSAVKVLSDAYDIFKLYPFGNFLRLGYTFSKLLYGICEHIPELCKKFVESLAAEGETGNIDYKEISKLFYYEPGGTSLKNILHWLQVYKNKKMHRFDYGKEENIRRYGKETPLDYNLNNLKEWNIPIFITISPIDPFSSITDVNNLLNMIKNKNLIHRLELQNYNHVDYTWSKNSKEDIYDKIIDFLDENGELSFNYFLMK